MYEGEEVDGFSVVSCGDAAEVFEFVEASFDAIARFVDLEVVGDLVFSGRVAGDDGGGAGAFDEGAEVVAVVSLVGEHVSRPEAVQQGRRLGHVAGLTGGEQDAQRPALGIGGQVDFSGQSASGTPQSLVPAPPFPVAAC